MYFRFFVLSLKHEKTKNHFKTDTRDTAESAANKHLDNVPYTVHCIPMTESMKILPARFFETETGREPVKEWLLELAPEDRKAIGDDIRVAEFGWPIGMPLCRAIKGHKGLWEIRVNLSGGRKARVFFCAYEENMVLLHGFIKKSQKTPINEMAVAVKRMKGLRL